MFAALILALSVLALLQFAVSQWRLLWISTANQPLSDTLRVETGIDGESIGANDFARLVGLCDELSPSARKATPWLKEVGCYYCILAKAERALLMVMPGMAAWASKEMATCARFVAVVLDQNLAVQMDRQAAVRSV